MTPPIVRRIRDKARPKGGMATRTASLSQNSWQQKHAMHFA